MRYSETPHHSTQYLIHNWHAPPRVSNRYLWHREYGSPYGEDSLRVRELSLMTDIVTSMSVHIWNTDLRGCSSVLSKISMTYETPCGWMVSHLPVVYYLICLIWHVVDIVYRTHWSDLHTAPLFRSRYLCPYGRTPLIATISPYQCCSVQWQWEILGFLSWTKS